MSIGGEVIDRIVDDAWASLLASVLKKRDILRPVTGDEVDLYVPQSRLLFLTESNPGIPKLLYLSAQSSARRNAHTILRKLGMPADYFWKFEYWPKARASTTLGQIVGRVFSAIMRQAKEGNMKMEELEIEPLRIGFSFEDCVECAGITGLKQGICYYHAGTFSGIVSALINRDLDSFETSCYARGDKSCHFILGEKTDKDIITAFDTYISPREVSADLASRLEKSLQNLPVRAQGNLVDVNYLQLVMASTLLANPQQFASTNFGVGCELGRKLASVLPKCYGREELQNISHCYSQLRHSTVEIKESESRIELVIKECAESVGQKQMAEMISFLSGELQGLASELTKREMTLQESRFEGDKLLLVFAPKA